MKAIAAYMANKTHEGDNRRNEYREPDRRDYDRRSEYDGAESRVYNTRQPDHYPARSAMGGYQPEGNEMRRRRDSRGRYMMDEPTSPESRYRGRDGRWKAGTRRSEYDGGAAYNDPTGRQIRDDDDMDDDVEANVIQWPYGPDMPHMPPDGRMIGFGNRPREYETRSHYDGGRQEAEVGGTMWMQPVEERHRKEMMELDKETAEKWVRGMRNEDPNRPTGARWSMDELKPMAQKFGIKPESDEFIEFYAMTNAMYSDYCEVAKKFNITSPEYYGMMAKAWMEDRDAVPNKTAMYYECCVIK